MFPALAPLTNKNYDWRKSLLQDILTKAEKDIENIAVSLTPDLYCMRRQFGKTITVVELVRNLIHHFPDIVITVISTSQRPSRRMRDMVHTQLTSRDASRVQFKTCFQLFRCHNLCYKYEVPPLGAPLTAWNEHCRKCNKHRSHLTYEEIYEELDDDDITSDAIARLHHFYLFDEMDYMSKVHMEDFFAANVKYAAVHKRACLAIAFTTPREGGAFSYDGVCRMPLYTNC